MPKIGEKKTLDEVFDSYHLNEEQLKAFEKRVDMYDSDEAFFVGIHAIKLGTKPREWIVMQYDGLTGKKEPITGMVFPNDIPYMFYEKCLEQLMKREKRRDFAIKMREKDLEQMAIQNEDLTDVNF